MSAVTRKPYTLELEEQARPELDRFFERAAQVRWSPDDIAYDKIDRAKLTLADLFAVFVTLHIENYSDVYTRLLLEHYDDSPRIREFIQNWEREEENHARVLERYLTRLGLPLEELRASYAKVDKSDFPFPSHDQAGLNAFVFLQELLTRESYTKILKNAREPVLIDILKRVIRDEERHYRFYRHTLELRMQLDRKDTLKQFKTMLCEFTMPQTMFRQQAMTGKMMEYYRYELSEILNIARPVVKVLGKMQAAWLLPQSSYVRRHVRVSAQNALGLGSVSKPDQQYVQSILDRLHVLLNSEKISGAEVAVHDRLAAGGLGVGDSAITKLTDAI